MKKYMFDKFFKSLKADGFQIVYWDNTVGTYGKGEPKIKIIFNEEIPFNAFMQNLEIMFCEAYMDGKIDIEGNFEEIMKVLEQNKHLLSRSPLTAIKKLTSI